MKIIVHAPLYMAGRAAGIAAKQFNDGAFENTNLLGIISGEHCFTIRRNKGGLSVWHFLKPDGEPNPDKWEAA